MTGSAHAYTCVVCDRVVDAPLPVENGGQSGWSRDRCTRCDLLRGADAAGAAADPRAASPFAASTSSAGPARGLGTDASSYQAFGADDGDIGAGSGSFFGATPHGSGTI